MKRDTHKLDKVVVLADEMVSRAAIHRDDSFFQQIVLSINYTVEERHRLPAFRRAFDAWSDEIVVETLRPHCVFP